MTVAQRPPFEIFRGADAPGLVEHGGISLADATPEALAGLQAMDEAGATDGGIGDVPYSRPEMSLSRLVLKSGYPLPLHTHDCNCLYYIAAGSVVIGTETVRAGDGFYVGAEVPYGYVAGPEGAIVLEFRALEHFNIRFRIGGEAGWAKMVDQVAGARERWAGEALPELR